MDAETTLLIAASRRRRALADELLGELDQAIEEKQSAVRVVSAPGWREVGLARFRATRVVREPRRCPRCQRPTERRDGYCLDCAVTRDEQHQRAYAARAHRRKRITSAKAIIGQNDLAGSYRLNRITARAPGNPPGDEPISGRSARIGFP